MSQIPCTCLSFQSDRSPSRLGMVWELERKSQDMSQSMTYPPKPSLILRVTAYHGTSFGHEGIGAVPVPQERILTKWDWDMIVIISTSINPNQVFLHRRSAWYFLIPARCPVECETSIQAIARNTSRPDLGVLQHFALAMDQIVLL